MEKEAEEQQAQGEAGVGAGPTAGPGYGEAGTQEGAENIAPTANENVVSSLNSIKDKILIEENSEWKYKALNRVIEKQKIKEEGENIDH